jgi:hypothetical protein
MKRALIPLMLGFGITLALVIGQRLTTDAMAVVLGVAVGVAASVLLMALLRRATREASWRPEAPPVAPAPAYPQFAQPNIIVLNPADLLGQRGGPSLLNLPQPPPLEALQEAGLRRLRVVGDDEDWR